MNYSDLLDVRRASFETLCKYVGWDPAEVIAADSEDDIALWAEVAPPTRDAILHIAMLNQERPVSVELAVTIALHYRVDPTAVLCAYGWTPPPNRALTFEQENLLRVAARTNAYAHSNQ